ncbi:MAG: TonB-dependent receptor [Verrucomicrobia bacterium]|nr:TonB-dependent receptor [Verrucomicrobiota bacterium]
MSAKVLSKFVGTIYPMYKYLLLLNFLLPSILFSQNIKGKLIDSDGEALPYATVQLLDKDSSLIKVEASGVDGSFQFTELEISVYYINLSFLGFQPKVIKLDLAKEKGNIGTTVLKPQSTELQEVTVTAEKPLIQVEPDKTIFNVDKNLSTAGDNGVELLRKAPGLQVDNDDNVILEGKAGVNIYINGKQSFLQGEDLKNYLRSLQADEIESVEIITQPSSKYDAAGSGGILNIVLKREKGLGTKGTVTNTITFGDYARNNTSFNLNYRNANYALFGNYSHFQGSSTNFFNIYREQGPNVFDGKTKSKTSFLNDQLSVGGEIYLSKNSTVSIAMSGLMNNNDSKTDSRTLMAQNDDFIIDSVLLAPNRNESEVENYTVSFNYTYKDSLDRRLSVDADWVNYQSIALSNQPNIYTSPNEAVVLGQIINAQETPIDIQVLSSQADYEQKVGKGTFSTGIKASQVSTNNIFDFYNVQDGKEILDINRSNTFDYEEIIGAAYLNYKFAWKKWKMQMGLRAEQTLSKGDLQSVTQVANKIVERNYLNWFPSGGLTFQPNRHNSLALTYSRRIQRPNYRNLNPFESQINELSFRRGNPFLQPQYTYNIKISNTYKYTLNTSFTFSYVSDFFAEVSEAEGERISFINTRNVADQQV